MFLLGLILNIAVYAQDGKLSEEKRREFEAQKVAFFTQQLELTPTEAAVFWPLYNEMQKKIREIEFSMKKDVREVREAKGLTEKDFQGAVKKMLKEDKMVQNTKEEYYLKLMTVVPASKIWKLNEAERKFHRQLFDKLRKGPGSPHR